MTTYKLITEQELQQAIASIGNLLPWVNCGHVAHKQGISAIEILRAVQEREGPKLAMHANDEMTVASKKPHPLHPVSLYTLPEEPQ